MSNRSGLPPLKISRLFKAAMPYALAAMISLPPAWAASSLPIEEAVAIALRQSPELQALNAQTEALDAVVPQMGALPDPMLSLNVMNLPTDSFDLDQEPMTNVQVAVMQSIPFPGKRRLKREAAELEVQANRARLAERRDAVTGAVRIAWWRLFFLDRSLAVVAQNQDLMRDFIEIAQAKYSVGSGLQQDVLLAQLELSKLFDREARLRGQRRSAQTSLNGLLNRPNDTAIDLAAAEPSLELPDPPSEPDLLAQAAASRPLLHAQREMLRASEKRVALAKRDVYPDFRLGAGYGFRQGDDPMRGGERADFFSVMFSVNVPLYSGTKQSRAVDQRSSEREQRRYALDGVLRQVETEVGRRLADYEAACEQVALLETAIIPQAEQTVASMLAGYQVNKVDFLNVVNGQLALYNAQLSYWQAMRDAKQALAGLAAAVGTEALYE